MLRVKFKYFLFTSMSRKRPKRLISFHTDYKIDTSDDDNSEMVTIPNPDNSGCSDDPDFDSASDEKLPRVTFREARKYYTEDQSKLEKDHQYNWMDGGKCYPDGIDDKLQLSESVMKNIQKSELVELFKKFFSISMKEYIIEACKKSEFDLQLDDLNTFIGIIILSSINKRKSE